MQKTVWYNIKWKKLMKKNCQTTFETAACIRDSAKSEELHQQMIAHYKILSCHCFGQFQYKELTTELHNNSERYK